MQVEPLTAATALTTWQADPVALILAALLGAGYAAGLRRTPGWPPARTAAFYGLGIGSLLVVSVTFIGGYAPVLFWVRAVQIVVLFMIAPLGLAMGAPLTLLGPAGRRLLNTAPARWLSHPATGAALILGTPWLLLFTGWYEAAQRDPAVDALTRLALLAIGFVYFAGRLQADPMPHRHPHAIGLVISVVEEIVDGVLGLVLWLGPHLVAAGYYVALHRSWGPDLRTDQVLAAGVLWVGGDLAALPFLGAMLRRMTVRHDQRVAEMDRELDATEAARALPGDPEGPVLLRPWWEDDPTAPPQ